MDLNDTARARRSKKRQSRAEAIIRDDIAFVMSDEKGRRFMYELLFFRLGLQDVYEGNDSGIHRHEGKRSAAVRLGRELQEYHAEAYILMHTERMEFIRNNKAIRDADDVEPGDDDAS